VHHKLEELLNQYLETSGLRKSANTPLVPIAVGKMRKLGNPPARRIDAARMLTPRLDAGLSDAFSPHSFRATGITNFWRTEEPRSDAAHRRPRADSRTTKLYDRRVRRCYWRTWRGFGTDFKTASMEETKSCQFLETKSL
jgi:integrase/recombinase XerD